MVLSMFPNKDFSRCLLTKIFRELSNEELLRKCIHGETQNANESFSNIIWMKCRKQVFVERSFLQLCVNSAILQFNEGQFGIAKVFKKLGIQNGVCLTLFLIKLTNAAFKVQLIKHQIRQKQKEND